VTFTALSQAFKFAFEDKCLGGSINPYTVINCCAALEGDV